MAKSENNEVMYDARGKVATLWCLKILAKTNRNYQKTYLDWIYQITSLNANLAGTKITAEAEVAPGNSTLETATM